MKITDIQNQKKNKNRVSVFVDGEYSFSLEDTDMVRLKVKIGNEITKEDIENYNRECNLTKAKNRVMDIINRRLLPKKAVIDDLIKRGFDKQIATEAAKEFENLGYIDDYFFASEYAKDAFEYKKHGKLRIINDLCQKGIAKDIAKDVLDELELNEKDNLLYILKSRFANTDFSDFKEKNKVIRYFATRGYNISDIMSAIDKLK
ncbi:MAG: regulatory protein RecX [Ruminococcaceae bacterium]|nr:regulatory protein RecX [Oscillospiraceae bacterium]